MTAVHVNAWEHGDGWLTVDTQAWINDRGEYARDLTGDLREWMDAHGHRWPENEVLAAWVLDRTGVPSVGLHGDGSLWHHQLCNFADHLLDDFGFTVLSACQWGDLVIIVSDRFGCYVSPEVYRSTVSELEDWADYSDAVGECVHGHRWQTHDAVTLCATDGGEPGCYRVTDRVRVPFGDRRRAYVACPDCGKAVHFENRF